MPRLLKAFAGFVSFAPLLLAVACTSSEPAGPPALTLVPAGVVALEEPESAPLGMTGGFLRLEDGGFLLSDRQRGTLLRFAADGKRVAEIGRRGSGPGEWESGPFGIFGVTDSTIAVSDGALLKVFAPSAPLAAWTRTQSPMTAAFAAGHGAVFSRRIDRDRRSTLARFRGPTDSIEVGGPFPSQVGRSQMVDMMLVFVAATPIGSDSLAVFTQGSDYLFVGPFAGPYDSVLVTPVTRRGAMPTVLGAVRDDDPASGMKAAYKASYPLGVHRLSSPGHIAVLTIDQEFLGNRMAGALHVAVANVRTRVACGEVKVPVASDPQPWAVVARDTLFVFAHETDSTSAQSQPRVRKFGIAATGC